MVSLAAGALYINNLTLPLPTLSSVPMSLVVRGVNNSLFYRTFNVSMSTWNPWIQLPGQTSDSPAAVLVGNDLHIVIRGADQSLSYGYVDVSGVFSNWIPIINSSTPSAPTLTSNGTALCLVVRSEDNRTEYRFYNLVSRTWNDWAVLPNGTTFDSPAATIYAGQLHVVVRDIDGYKIWHSYGDTSTGNFSEWQSINGTTQSAPTLTTSNSLNEICLIIRGLNNVTSYCTWSGSSWTSWVDLPNGVTCDGPGACVIGNELRVVVRDIGGIILWQGSVNLATAIFSGWTEIDGSALSRPMLAG